MSVSELTLLKACEVLFGPELRVNSDFLIYLQCSGVKKAFRKRAKETHPDLQPIHSREKVTAPVGFEEVYQAYITLKQYIDQKTRTAHTINSAPPSAADQFDEGRFTRKDVSAATDHFTNLRENKRSFRSNSRILPQNRLKFGRFLYYAGVAEWHDVIDALVWQRTSRPRLGELALRQGVLHEPEIRAICRNRMIGKRFGDLAREMGLLTEEQVLSLRHRQKLQQPKIGRYFVINNILVQQELYQLVRDCHLHNMRYATSMKV